MNRLVLITAALIAVLPLLWTAPRYYRARTSHQSAISDLRMVTAQAAELASLWSAAPPETRRGRPSGGLASRLAQTVAACGLPQSALHNVTPELESPLTSRGRPLHRATARLTLEPVTLPELGRFLHQWRTVEPTWTVSSVDLAPSNRPAGEQQKALRAAIVIETVFAPEVRTGEKN